MVIKQNTVIARSIQQESKQSFWRNTPFNIDTKMYDTILLKHMQMQCTIRSHIKDAMSYTLKQMKIYSNYIIDFYIIGPCS